MLSAPFLPPHPPPNPALTCILPTASQDAIFIDLFPTDGSSLETYLVGMDGVRLNPTNSTGERFALAAGQRLGVVPCTGGGQPASSAPIWIRTQIGPDGPNGTAVQSRTWALLDLDGRYPTDETESIAWEDAPPLPAGMTPADSAKAGVAEPATGGAPILAKQFIIPPLGDLVPPKPTKTIVFNMDVTKNPSDSSNQYTINGVSLQPPDDGPSFIELVNGPGYTRPEPNSSFPGNAGWNVYDNKLGDVVEFVINNFSPKVNRSIHPFHTHGKTS